MEQIIYIYRLSYTGNFAPCIQDNKLTLACCKGGRKNEVNTGIRYWIGEKNKQVSVADSNVYVMGIYKDYVYYFAKITNVMEMTEYYKEGGLATGRNDCIYKVENGELVHNGSDAHDKDESQTRDKYGKYVLISEGDNFYHFGEKNFPADEIKNLLLDDYPKKQEVKTICDDKTIEDIVRIIKKNEKLQCSPITKDGTCDKKEGKICTEC